MIVALPGLFSYFFLYVALCFVNVAFPGYLHLFFNILHVFFYILLKGMLEVN